MNEKKQRKRIVTMLLVVALALNMGVAPRKSEAKNITLDEAKEYNVFTWEEVSQNGKYELEKVVKVYGKNKRGAGT